MAKEFKLHGVKEAFAILDGLPNELRAKALQSVHKSILRKTMRNTMRDPEIKKKTKIGNEIGNPTGVLFGVSKKFDWLMWREYGTKRRTRKSGGDTGIFKKSPFWAIHINRMIPFFFKTMNTEYAKLIGGFIKRNVRKNTKVGL